MSTQWQSDNYCAVYIYLHEIFSNKQMLATFIFIGWKVNPETNGKQQLKTIVWLRCLSILEDHCKLPSYVNVKLLPKDSNRIKGDLPFPFMIQLCTISVWNDLFLSHSFEGLDKMFTMYFITGLIISSRPYGLKL